MPSHDHGHHHDHAHSDGHDHGDHGHAPGIGGHSHAPTSFGKAFAVGIALNASYVVAQIFYGAIAHSVALLADAVHNLGDVLGLVIAWGTMRLAQRRPTPTRTYGWGRSTILASLGNAVVLLLGCGAIAVEAMHRFGHPKPVASGTVMWVAAIGILINGGTALMFMRGRKDDLNIKGAFLHMASDAFVSAGVVIAALAIGFTGWLWLDPAASLAIAIVITIGTWGLLRDSVNLAMDVVPGGIELPEVERTLLALPGVIEVHDLHVWALSTTETALTAHLIRSHTIQSNTIQSNTIQSNTIQSSAARNAAGNADALGADDLGADGLIRQACSVVRERFRIGHSTFQVETAESADACGLRPADVV